jgi:hypothetical protein
MSDLSLTPDMSDLCLPGVSPQPPAWPPSAGRDRGRAGTTRGGFLVYGRSGLGQSAIVERAGHAGPGCFDAETATGRWCTSTSPTHTTRHRRSGHPPSSVGNDLTGKPRTTTALSTLPSVAIAQATASSRWGLISSRRPLAMPSGRQQHRGWGGWRLCRQSSSRRCEKKCRFWCFVSWAVWL